MYRGRAYRIRRLNYLFERDGAECRYCKKPLNFMTATIDHKIPRASGGSQEISNLVLACGECNGRKGSLDYNQFIRILRNG
jgi:5-methylcytosine-specific restriction endonuclease McrA